MPDAVRLRSCAPPIELIAVNKLSPGGRGVNREGEGTYRKK